MRPRGNLPAARRLEAGAGRRQTADMKRPILLLLAAALAGAPAGLRAEPMPAQPAEAKRAADRELDALQKAATEQEAGILEATLLNIWLDAVSPAARLLATRGLRDLQAGATGEA